MGKSLADALFSRIRQGVLGLLFTRPEQSFHGREIARLTGFAAQSVLHELENLLGAGILTEQRLGRMRLFQANPLCPLYEELRAISRKTFGITYPLQQALAEIQGIELALVFGSVARSEDTASSDVDVMIVGDCSYHAVLQALHGISEVLGREINPQVYSREEFRQRLQTGNPFIEAVLHGPILFLKGDAHGLQTLQSGQSLPSP